MDNSNYYNNQQQGHVLDWDDEIEEDNPSFTLLPDGIYNFTVTNMERGYYQPREGSKLPPCNMAILTIQVTADNGMSATITHRLYLHSSTEGRIGQFFVSIGLKPKGQKRRMEWNRVPMSQGRCRVRVRTYTGNDGTERKTNDIVEFLEPETVPAPVQPQQSASMWQQPAQPQYQQAPAQYQPQYQQPAPQQTQQQTMGGFATNGQW